MLGYSRSLQRIHAGLPADWLADLELNLGKARIENDNGSTGRATSVMVAAGVGPEWVVYTTLGDRVALAACAFAGIGYTDYTNNFTTSSGGLTGETGIESDGAVVEYGIRIHARWIWTANWGDGVYLGVVRRHAWLSGDSTTQWSNGMSVSDDYASEDTISAFIVGFSLEGRL